jgi:hypothetical protein
MILSREINRWVCVFFFFSSLGMRVRKDEMEKKKNPVIEFPEKMDKLLVAIDKVNNINILILNNFYVFFSDIQG